jgi:integrase
MAVHVCRYLKRRSVLRTENITEDHLRACHRLFRKKFPKFAGSVHVLSRFLRERGLVQAAAAPEPSRKDIHLNSFRDHLLDARGYAPKTVKYQIQVAAEFLDWLNYEQAPEQLSSLRIEVVDDFIRRLGKRMGRVALQKPIAILRNLLRFFAFNGIVAPGLDTQIYTPHIYRREKLPRALPWQTVQALLRSVNRNLASGKRDYAMFALMATYGLRSCDIVALTLEDIHWRAGIIKICQSKTNQPLELPLTDEVGSAILDYLKNVPRYGAYRQVFLRLRAPGGILKPTAVTEAFQAWSKRSGLEIPFQGAHCIRHSYALYLLRHGLPLKTIGDLLGHRSSESTDVYLRLATEDLREVGLHIPISTPQHKEK